MEELFREYFVTEAARIEPIAASGSNRRYWRLTSGDGGTGAIAAVGTDAAENRAFVAFARHFASLGLPVPRIYAVSPDGMTCLQEDLGDISLYSRLDDRSLVRRTVALLPRFQVLGARGLDFSLCHPVVDFDLRSVMFDLNYFKYCFLKPSGLEFNEMRLQDDFETLAGDLLAEPSDFFMYRDFQSRNVMVRDGEPFFIDFQGGRRGPLQYDLASFAWQAKAGFPEDFREELVEVYLDALEAVLMEAAALDSGAFGCCGAEAASGSGLALDRDAFRASLRLFVLFRTMQVLGAYGFRGLVEKKPHFIESIPFALRNLSRALEQIPQGRYPYLAEVLGRLVTEFVPRTVALVPKGLPEGVLAIDVMSFSYKKGIPDDCSGNGGGYVFDCRGMKNPGRYDEYKQLTGLDRPVIDFLEDCGEVQTFVSEACALVRRHADCFLARGFSHLSVFFGCTGGHHRSVYSAEHAAALLKEAYCERVRVRLVHRELGIERVL